MPAPRFVLFAFALICLAAFSFAAPPSERIDRPTSKPYEGDLSIFEGADRAEKLQIERVMDLLGIRAGGRVADIGAGSGWFTVRAARRVGATGAVFAVEINPAAVQFIRKRAAKEKLPNIRTILGRTDDPKLPPQSVDAVLLLKTYHEIAAPIALLRKVRPALKPGARLGIIDRKGNGGDHGLDAARVIEEAKRAGFELVAQHDFVKGDDVDYFLIFR